MEAFIVTRHGRRDANEGPIVDYLRAAGYTVIRLEDPDQHDSSREGWRGLGIAV